MLNNGQMPIFAQKYTLNKHPMAKYYVVWKGFAPGVYDSWEEAEIQVSGYPEASYRSFSSLEAAVEAFREGFDKEGLLKEVKREMERLTQEGTVITYKDNSSEKAQANKGERRLTSIGIRDVKVSNDTMTRSATVNDAPQWITESIAVDAACSGNPGPMEYRGVYLRTGQEIFKVGPMQGGTNNIGEFLAIVHGLALQEKKGTQLPIYSDSVNAQKWVRTGICKTTLEENDINAPIFDLIRRAESWLRTHTFRVPIYKWETKQWGEIPADFGRK